MPVVASIGCTEPWNAAGLGLDIRALAACGVRPVTIVAGVTAQDADGVSAAMAMTPELVRAQLAALAGAGIAAYRIGALLDRASVETIAAHLHGVRVPIVYDPVLAPSGGGAFASGETVVAIRELLVPLVTIVMPNLGEARALTGVIVETRDAMERAARALVASGAKAALVKGGHLGGEPVDVLVDADGDAAYAAPRIVGTLRGTGCLLACAVAASLARGEPLREAVVAGRTFVRERFAAAHAVGGMYLGF